MRIRKYRQADAASVGRLICETYRTYNLSHADLDEQDRLLGPFKHAFSDDVEHQRAIRMVIHSPVVYVAEIDEEVVGLGGKAIVLDHAGHGRDGDRGQNAKDNDRDQ